MTWSMFSIGWLRLHDTTKGQQLFNKNFDYIDPSFQVTVCVAVVCVVMLSGRRSVSACVHERKTSRCHDVAVYS